MEIVGNGKEKPKEEPFVLVKIDPATRAINMQSNCVDHTVLLGLLEMAKIALIEQRMGKAQGANIVVPQMRVKMN